MTTQLQNNPGIENFLAHDAKLISGEVFGTLINLSGRRRVTSQRIILFSVLASMGQDGAMGEAQAALGLFTQAHALLIDGDRTLPGVFSEALHAAYFGALQGNRKMLEFIMLAQQTQDAIRANSRPAPGLLEQLVGSANPMLALSNQITLLYEDELKRHAVKAKKQLTELMTDIQSISLEARVISVNAQIIAARAGSAGREFSVVARALSDITAKIDTLAHLAMNRA